MDFQFPEDKIISFHQFHVLYNHVGDLNTMCQLYCFNRYLNDIHLYSFHFSECECECVYILLCKNEILYALFIVGQ